MQYIGKEFRLDLIGRDKILSYFSGFDLSGFITDFKVLQYRMLDNSKGVVTYSIKLRGYTGGNVDIEIPVMFDIEVGEVQRPVIGYINGNVILLSEGVLNSLLDSFNLKRKFYPGWISFNYAISDKDYNIYNDWNKYRVASLEDLEDNDLMSALNGYFLCLGASKDTLLNVIRDRASYLCRDGVSYDDASVYMVGSYLGGNVDFFDIKKVVNDVYNFSKRYAQGELEIPEYYERIEFPEIADLLDVIKLYHVIRFAYRKLNGEYTTRVVEPHYLWYTNKGNVILIGWDYSRGDWRAFDLNRIRDVDVMYLGDWIELGKFLAMVQSYGKVPDDYRDVFKPRGPYHDFVVNVRGSLNNLRDRTKPVLSIMIDKIGKVIDERIKKDLCDG